MPFKISTSAYGRGAGLGMYNRAMLANEEPRSEVATPTGMFHGWWIVMITMLGLSISTGTVVNYAFGVFVKPLAEEFSANRGSIGLAIAVMNIFVSMNSPLVGRLADRYGSRRVIVAATVGLSGCLAGLSFVKPPLWHLYLLYALTGIVGAGVAPVPYARVISNWFHQRRGFALGLANTGMGAGAFVIPSLAQFLIDEAGWRQAYMVLGMLPLVICAPLVWLFLADKPEDLNLSPDGPTSTRTVRDSLLAGDTLAEALRTRTFWQLCIIIVGLSACGNGTISHLAAFLTDQGISGRNAALAISIFGATSIAGRLGTGYLVDRIFAPYLSASMLAGAAAGLAMLWSGAGGPIAGIFLPSCLLGLALGAEGDVMPFLVSRYFGMRAMGALFGIVFACYTLGAASGQYLFGVAFDATGSYRFPLACATGIMLLASLGTLGLGKYRHPHS